MRTLWLTLADPDPPTNGQFLYSHGLIHAMAAAGARLDVLGLARGTKRRLEGVPDGKFIRWWRAPDDRPITRRQHLSPLPNIAYRATTPELADVLRARLAQRDLWDAIVIDSICAGWALDDILEYLPRSRRPQLVYIAHNHESSVTVSQARDEPNPLRRLVRGLDAVKVAMLESRLVRNADLVTANTTEDCQKFRRRHPDKPVQCLPPGYSGQIMAQRRIDETTPRTVVIIGSFDWPPKRHSLESFLSAAKAPLEACGVALKVVGAAAEDYLNYLRRLYPSVEFTGPVPDVMPFMASARAALVVDQLGGFKLKSLDYVFNRLPIIAIDGSVPGVPLVPGESILLHPDHASLAEAVCRAIDDFDLLNRLQGNAFEACRYSFSWTTVGLSLLGAMNGMRRQPAPPASGAPLRSIRTDPAWPE